MFWVLQRLTVCWLVATCPGLPPSIRSPKIAPPTIPIRVATARPLPCPIALPTAPPAIPPISTPAPVLVGGVVVCTCTTSCAHTWRGTLTWLTMGVLDTTRPTSCACTATMGRVAKIRAVGNKRRCFMMGLLTAQFACTQLQRFYAVFGRHRKPLQVPHTV